jgi:hypothetical protein
LAQVIIFLILFQNKVFVYLILLFQKNIITLGINKILYFLDNIDILTYIIIILIWDLYGINQMKLLYNNSSLNNINYGEFVIIYII